MAAPSSQGPPGKLYYLALWRNDPLPAKELCVETDLSSVPRFSRSTVQQWMSEIYGKTWAERTKPSQRVSEQPDPEQRYLVHAISRSEGVACIAITDMETTKLSGQQCVQQTLEKFLDNYPKTSWATASTISFPGLKQQFEQYKEPNTVNKIGRIQQELDETRGVLQNTIQSVLQRGEKIDNLVQKSDGLSAQSKMFYTQAKKQNSCCTVM